jgi:hypothetical protein
VSRSNMAVLNSKQKWFTEEEVSRLTGICAAHLRNVAVTRRLGQRNPREEWFFTNSDVMILSALHPRCVHAPDGQKSPVAATPVADPAGSLA